VPTTLRYVQYVLWIAPVTVFVCLVATVLRRKMVAALPVFFAFTVLQVVEQVLLLFFYHLSSLQYYYAYWTFAALDMAMGFAVLHEVFAEIFRPFSELRQFGAILFRWAALVLALGAALMATNSTPVYENRIFAVILNLSRSLEVMQCGLVLLILLCCGYIGVTLRHRIFGIALGFGVIAAVDLIAVTLLAQMGRPVGTFVVFTKMAAYNVAVLIWFGYIHGGRVQPEPAKRIAYAEPWDYALAAVLHPGIDAPALPLIEDVVERVWAQANGNSHGDEVRSQNTSQ
jgi:hypothetical protein